MKPERREELKARLTVKGTLAHTPDELLMAITTTSSFVGMMGALPPLPEDPAAAVGSPSTLGDSPIVAGGSSGGASSSK